MAAQWWVLDDQWEALLISFMLSDFYYYLDLQYIHMCLYLHLGLNPLNFLYLRSSVHYNLFLWSSVLFGQKKYANKGFGYPATWQEGLCLAFDHTWTSACALFLSDTHTTNQYYEGLRPRALYDLAVCEDPIGCSVFVTSTCDTQLLWIHSHCCIKSYWFRSLCL